MFPANPNPNSNPNPCSTAARVFVADLPAGYGVVEALFTTSPGSNVRQWKARWPNGDPAKPRDGYSSQGDSVTTPAWPATTPAFPAFEVPTAMQCVWR